MGFGYPLGQLEIMEIIADLHLHSKYSRAVSQSMTLPIMSQFARQKGLNLLTTGDWTHPIWLREIKNQLHEVDSGVYGLRTTDYGKTAVDGSLRAESQNDPRFILSVEISSIYSQGGKARRIHCLLFVPSIEIAEKMNQELVKRGCNISSDGRPIVGLTPQNILEILIGIDERSFLIPCHVWTPWFSLYGSMSGFDSIDECFGDYSKYIYGVETGLSSDPSMNWRIKELENRSILSFSDSHSPMKMGRESTVFELEKLTFDNLKKAIMQPSLRSIKSTKGITSIKGRSPSGTSDTLDTSRILYTVEFYPEEGKYHYTGHRNCKVVYSPQDTREKGKVCPVCGRGLTIGVMERVEALASSPEKIATQTGKSGIAWITDPAKLHPPYAKLVPLNEIIAESLSSTAASVKVKAMFDQLTEKFGSEFEVLLKTPVDEIEKIAGNKIANGILRVRNGNIFIHPGYDGEYGVVKIEAEDESVNKQKTGEQESLGI